MCDKPDYIYYYDGTTEAANKLIVIIEFMMIESLNKVLTYLILKHI